MGIKKKAKKLTFDEMPVLKKAIEEAKENDYQLNLGACMVSNNILTGKGKFMWCYRHEPQRGADVDNGWEFLSDIDTTEFLNIAENWSVINCDHMFCIEPSILGIIDLPPGSDLIFIEDERGKHYYDANTDEEVISFCSEEQADKHGL